MDFIRSSSICGTDTTSVFFDKLQPREQINQLTAFIDGSQVRLQKIVVLLVINNIHFNYITNLFKDLRIHK